MAPRSTPVPPRAGGLFFAFLSCIVFASCNGCDPDVLDDTSCHPGAPSTGYYDENLHEICKNGIDDNCDKQIDEGCDCNSDKQPPDTMTCGGDGNGNTIGACEPVTVTCVDGHFPGCTPERWPGDVPDTDCDGVDDDCDGQTDEDYVAPECWTGREDSVFNESSVCAKGKKQCVNGSVAACGGQTLPGPERCNNRDDDCDGAIDEVSVEAGTRCGPPNPTGRCRSGHNICTVGGEVLCQDAVYATGESCNDIDDDCDGRTDEDEDGLPIINRCETRSPEGNLCDIGVAECNDGNFVNCSARAYEPLDICDGVDNDCDGEIDEDIPCPCQPGEFKPCKEPPMTGGPNGMMCGLGIQECIVPPGCDTTVPESCIPIFGDCEFFKIEPEDCNGWDDDCDAMTDEDDQGDPLAAMCGSEDNPGIGECRLGESVCSGGRWGECVGEVVATEEMCDQLDNDCDGDVDEDLNPHEQVDLMIMVDNSGSMSDKIQALRDAMAQWSGEFLGSPHRFGLAIVPGDVSSVLPWSVITQPTDITSFQVALASISANGGASEPSYDALYDSVALFSPPVSTMVQWRADAYPYVVFIGDEQAQSLLPRNLVEQQVAAVMTSCMVGMCVPGDKVEVFLIIDHVFDLEYDTIVYGEVDKRIHSISPPDVSRYVEILRRIFANVCLPPSADGGMAGADGGSTSGGQPDGGSSGLDAGP